MRTEEDERYIEQLRLDHSEKFEKIIELEQENKRLRDAVGKLRDANAEWLNTDEQGPSTEMLTSLSELYEVANFEDPTGL